VIFSKRLKWSEADDFGQVEANDHPYRYIAWNNKEYGELRIVRRANEGGIIIPLQDFSIYCRDREAAKRMAEEINKALRKARRYNKFQPLL
jgi:hypothetical protein